MHRRRALLRLLAAVLLVPAPALGGWLAAAGAAPATARSVDPPTSVTATASPDAVDVGWSAPDDPQVTSVVVRRSADGTPPASPTSGVQVYAGAAGGSLHDTRVAPGATYGYAVFARDAAGDYSEGATASAGPPATTWSASAPADPWRGAPADVSCPSSTGCMAVDSSGHALTYNGTTWSAPRAILPSSYNSWSFVAVSCPTTTFCLATTGNTRTLAIYRSGTWTTTSASQAWGPLDCASATRCLLTTSTGNRAAYWNGSTVGTSFTLPSVQTVRSVSCPTTSFCGVAGQSGSTAYALTTSGSSWRVVKLATGASGEYVSCTSSTACVAVDDEGAGRYWRFTGSAWGTRQTIQTSNGLTVDPQDLSCSSSTHCAVAGDDGTAWLWSGGSTWTRSTLVTSYGTNRHVDCASSTMCLMVDDRGRFSRSNGSSWTGLAAFDSTSGSPYDLACDTTTSCYLTDNLGAVTHWTGSGWVSPGHLSEVPSTLDCPVAGWCLSVDGQESTYRTIASGLWGAARSMGYVQPHGSTVCASASRCFSFIGGGLYQSWNGSTWSASTGTRLFSDSSSIHADCTGSTFCLAVDDDSHGYSVWNGSSWSAPKSWQSSGDYVSQLSCAGRSCLLTYNDAGSQWSQTFNGTSWSGRVAAPASGSPVGCLSATRCVTTDGTGTVTIWDGLDWAPTSTVLAGEPDVMHCMGTRCIVVGDGWSQWTT